MRLSRVLLIAMVTSCLSGSLAIGSPAANADEPALLWGVNGHPFTAYPGVSLDDQIAAVERLGLKSYRVNVTRADQSKDLGRLVRLAAARDITILPVLTPPLDLANTSADELFRQSKAFAEDVVRPLRGQVAVWELGNELENFAIINPCETKDDGAQYNCKWGPAGGVGVDEYFTPRWRKVSAVLKGLSVGVSGADSKARKAMGTAGWGHLGAFTRLRNDGVEWDISVWHVYSDNAEWAYERLQAYGKPIWITEFSPPNADRPDAEAPRPARLAAMIQTLRREARKYNIEAAFFYELLDEPYWGNSPEARYGLLGLVRDGAAWRIGAPHLSATTVQKETGPAADR
jgi:hypothetical protein